MQRLPFHGQGATRQQQAYTTSDKLASIVKYPLQPQFFVSALLLFFIIIVICTLTYRPVPSRLLYLCGRRKSFLLLLPAMLTSFVFAAVRSDLLLARVVAAVMYTLFSMGCAYALEWGHGQYPVLWTSWAMALSSLFKLGSAFEVSEFVFTDRVNIVVFFTYIRHSGY